MLPPAQAPFWQVAVPAQVLPQAPQCFFDVLRLTFRSPHVTLTSRCWQRPFRQRCPWPQSRLWQHRCLLMQRPPQARWPRPQRHRPWRLAALPQHPTPRLGKQVPPSGRHTFGFRWAEASGRMMRPVRTVTMPTRLANAARRLIAEKTRRVSASKQRSSTGEPPLGCDMLVRCKKLLRAHIKYECTVGDSRGGTWRRDRSWLPVDSARR